MRSDARSERISTALYRWGEGFRTRFRLAWVSLRVRNYRLYFVGQTISVAGNHMQALAVAFLVLDLTQSGTALGVAMGARLAPLVLFGPIGGLIADRLDKRRVLFVTQSLSAVGALALAVATGLDLVTYPFVLGVNIFMGTLQILDNPARQTLIAELVNRDTLGNAVALNSISINVARALGALLGGGLVALVGATTCFLINMLTFITVLVSLYLMTSSEITRSVPIPRRRGQLREGLAYAISTPQIALPLLMLTVTGILANEFQITLPLVATEAFGGGPETYGLMAAALALGSVVGGLVIASRKDSAGYETLAVTCLGWGTAILLAAVAPILPLELLALLAVGYGTISFNATSKTVLQLGARPEMRGRVMALWAIGWTGGAVVGGPIIGGVAELLGSRWALGIGGLSTVLLGMLTWPYVRRTAVAVDAVPEPEAR